MPLIRSNRPVSSRSRKSPACAGLFVTLRQVRLLLDLQLHTTVLRTTRVGGVVADRVVRTVADRTFQTVRGDAVAGQVVVHDLRTTLRQRLVVVRLALRVGVT